MAVILLMKCSHRSRTRKQSWKKRVAKKGVANIGSLLQYSVRELFFTVTRNVYISLIVVVPPLLALSYPVAPRHSNWSLLCLPPAPLSKTT